MVPGLQLGGASKSEADVPTKEGGEDGFLLAISMFSENLCSLTINRHSANTSRVISFSPG